PPALRARQHFHHFLPGISQKHSLMPTRYCKWVTVSGVSGGCSIDEIVVRISNPTNHAESLTEPSVACVSDRAPNVMISAWQSSDMPQPMPTFPAPKVFPVNLSAGDTVETTVFFLKSPAVEGIRGCRALRFAWINAAQARVLGPTIKLPPGTASLSVYGPSNASSM
ncbi:hypothetical protein, partial [Burkholderia sp. Se-20378]|uniref:hypothetical protein n=1 Tax=Burkholderia sp. Se-20378 TaxID=2703899 RepID=UPI001981E5E5